MITFPTTLRPQNVNAQFKSYGFLTKPLFGGDILRTNRPGSRFALAVTLPPVSTKARSGVLSDLIKGQSEGLRVLWEQGLEISPAIGTPLIDGAAQAGTSLNVKGLTPYTSILKDMFFSFEQSGESRLHIVTAEAQADANGDITLSIEPELRVSTADEAPVNFTAPVIDGFVEGESISWALTLGGLIIISFELIERY